MDYDAIEANCKENIIYIIIIFIKQVSFSIFCYLPVLMKRICV